MFVKLPVLLIFSAHYQYNIINPFSAGKELPKLQGLHNFLMTMNQCVVIDIETTGSSPKAHAEIIEIGAVKLNIPSKKIIGRFNQRIQPSETFSISQKITDITGIAWEDIKDKPFIEQYSRSLGNSLVICRWSHIMLPLIG